jgi:hypothetical protein
MDQALVLAAEGSYGGVRTGYHQRIKHLAHAVAE